MEIPQVAGGGEEIKIEITGMFARTLMFGLGCQ